MEFVVAGLALVAALIASFFAGRGLQRKPPDPLPERPEEFDARYRRERLDRIRAQQEEVKKKLANPAPNDRDYNMEFLRLKALEDELEQELKG